MSIGPIEKKYLQYVYDKGVIDGIGKKINLVKYCPPHIITYLRARNWDIREENYTVALGGKNESYLTEDELFDMETMYYSYKDFII